METMEKLSSHLKTRITDLSKQKENGVRIIGYTPGGYMPEELVHACGAAAVPVGLIRGGDPEPVAYSGAYLPRFLDTFCRSQIGYRVLEEEPLYQMLDVLIAPITDNNLRAIADSWNFYTDTEVFRFGVPHAKTEHAFGYYLDGLKLFKEKLEALTGNEITEARLREEIALSNRMRGLFIEISSLRKPESPLISGKEFIRLNHASFQADRHVMVDTLESLLSELKETKMPASQGPRILLTGSTLAMGDYKVLDLIEETGASVVVEEFAEGVRDYWENVEANGDLMNALAERYFMKRIPPAFFRPGRERLDFLVKLAGEFNVDGVVWYQLLYRDCYDIESFYFPQMLRKERDIPMLKIESDYDTAETGPFRTRIETFVETIKAR